MGTQCYVTTTLQYESWSGRVSFDLQRQEKASIRFRQRCNISSLCLLRLKIRRTLATTSASCIRPGHCLGKPRWPTVCLESKQKPSRSRKPGSVDAASVNEEQTPPSVSEAHCFRCQNGRRSSKPHCPCSFSKNLQNEISASVAVCPVHLHRC
jgi:hypothetical protein